MAVDAVRPSRIRLPPLPQRVAAEVSCSDPGLRVAVDPQGRIHLRGSASETDGPGGELALSFDGARVSACVKPGTSAAHAVALLEKALPEGYRLSFAEEPSGEIALEVIRSPNAPSPPQAQPSESSRGDAPSRDDAYAADATG